MKIKVSTLKNTTITRELHLFLHHFHPQPTSFCRHRLIFKEIGYSLAEKKRTRYWQSKKEKCNASYIVNIPSGEKNEKEET